MEPEAAEIGDDVLLRWFGLGCYHHILEKIFLDLVHTGFTNTLNKTIPPVNKQKSQNLFP